MGKIILAHGVIYPSFYTFTRHGEAWSDWISREIWENVKLMSISQPVLWIIPIFLWKITNFEENEIHFWLGHSFMNFFSFVCLVFLHNKSHWKRESSSFDLTRFPGIPFNWKRDLFPLRFRRLSFSPRRRCESVSGSHLVWAAECQCV